MLAHEEIKCMACGEQMEGPESPYTGECKNKDDPGQSTECNEEEFKSCMTGVISKEEIFPFETQQEFCSLFAFCKRNIDWYHYLVAKSGCLLTD